MKKKTASILALFIMLVFIVLTFIPCICEEQYWKSGIITTPNGQYTYGSTMSYSGNLNLWGVNDYGVLKGYTFLNYLILAAAIISVVAFGLHIADKKSGIVKITNVFPTVTLILYLFYAIVVFGVNGRIEFTGEHVELIPALGFFVGCVLLIVAIIFSILLRKDKLKKE